MHYHSIKVLIDLPELNVCMFQKNKIKCSFKQHHLNLHSLSGFCIDEKYLSSLLLGSHVYLLMLTIRLTCQAHFICYYDYLAPKSAITKPLRPCLTTSCMGDDYTYSTPFGNTADNGAPRCISLGWLQNRFAFKTSSK